MKVQVYTLNSFVKTEEGGNPAGVVPDSNGFSEDEMRYIAQEIGFSETAFVQSSECADYRVRFFTPSEEVDLCGHATIAVFSLLFQKEVLKPGKYTQETLAGTLSVEIRSNGQVFMEQALPEFHEEIEKEEIEASLNTDPDAICTDLPVQIVSTGLKDILIPLKDLETLLSIRPDPDAVTEISRKYLAVGYHLFCMETKYGSTAHCRNLAPLYGIPEESATGTSSGALSCYLYHHGIITDASALVFEQGYSMGKPSEILARLERDDEGNITQVMVGGKAAITGERTVEI
jgi:PhzF family phenazine biosynthesis protein